MKTPLWLASYPRSGNTFMRVLLHDCFGIAVAAKFENNPADLAIQKLLGHEQATPRASIFQKTHDHPIDGERCIYLVRDGRRAVLSYYRYLHAFTETRPAVEEVIEGSVRFGSWSEHFRAWSPLSRPESLLLRFEEFTENPPSAVSRLSEFLHLSPKQNFTRNFESMHKADPFFFRSGNNLSERLTEHQARLFEKSHGGTMRELGYDI